jgi:hypothetical protein
MAGKTENCRGHLAQRALKTVEKRMFGVNRTQNRLICVTAVIVIVLITAACSVFYNLQRFGAMQDLKETGVMTDVVFSEPDEKQLTFLRESSLVRQPLFLSYKAGRLVGNAGQSGLSLSLYAEENWELWSRPLFSDVQGHYPKKEREVMMSTWLLRRLGIEPAIGSEITLSVAWEDRDAVEEEKFVLSGYYTDTSYIDTASRQKVLVSEETLAKHKQMAEFVGFSFTDRQFGKKLGLVREQLSIKERQNFKVLGGQGFHLSPGNMGAALAVILFFMLDGFLIIYNINTISLTRDIQFYGLLQTIGTAPGQLGKILYCRMRRILLWSLPAGLLLGTVLTQWIVPVILGGMSLDEFIEYNTAHDIALYNSMSRASFSPREEQSFTPELVERLRSMEGVESFEITRVVPIYEHYSQEVYGDWLKIKREFEQINHMEPADTDLWLENPRAAFWGLLIGIDSGVIEEYNRSSPTPVDIERFERGEFLLTTQMNGDGLHPGSVITFSVMDTDQQFELPVGGQIPLERDGMNSGAAPWLVVSNKVIDRYKEDAIIYSVKIDSDSAYEESILEQVTWLTQDIPAIARTSKLELAKALEETKSALSKLSAFLTIVLFSVGIINFINTMSVSILGRQKEFVAMEAIGASQRQMRTLIGWEGLWYFALTLALSATLGTVADLLIFRIIKNSLGFGSFRYPALPMLVYMLLSLLLCRAIPAVIYQREGRQSIVERLRES